ncbi:MAG: hypothetical protein JXB34_02285 [Bacteroidales bacterium]|nr:hypothetical protein [Bacteroidales bacterium]
MQDFLTYMAILVSILSLAIRIFRKFSVQTQKSAQCPACTCSGCSLKEVCGK